MRVIGIEKWQERAGAFEKSVAFDGDDDEKASHKPHDPLLAHVNKCSSEGT